MSTATDAFVEDNRYYNVIRTIALFFERYGGQS